MIFRIHPTVDGVHTTVLRESAYYSEYPAAAACTIPTVAIPAAAALTTAVTLVTAATLAATTATPPATATPPSPLPLLLSTAATVVVVGSGLLHHACGCHHCSAAAGTDHIVTVTSSGSGPSSTSHHHHCCHCHGRDRFVGVAKLPPFVAAVMLEVVAVIVIAAQLPQSPLSVASSTYSCCPCPAAVAVFTPPPPSLHLLQLGDGAGAHTTATALSHRAWIAPPPPRVVVVAAWGPHPTVGASSGIGNGGGDDGVVPGWSAEEAAGMQTTPPPAAGKQVTTMPLPPSPHLPLYYGCNHDGHEHMAGSELGLGPSHVAVLLRHCTRQLAAPLHPFATSELADNMRAPAIPQDHATFAPPPYSV
ncbi:hypothetical protein EDB83DRAFT_2322450 [Lactarius deliciosus]|nr:hypothetical protein EDB83DRAFT_2322450 [Lactarius deliciosus]